MLFDRTQQMEFLKTCQPLGQKSASEITELIPKVVQVLSETGDCEKEAIKILMIACSRGPSCQSTLANSNEFLSVMRRSKPISELRMKLLANICVQNMETQKIVFDEFHEDIVSGIKCPSLANPCSMIVHQLLLSKTESVVFGSKKSEILENLLSHLDSEKSLKDFVLLALESLFSERDALNLYLKIQQQRLNFLRFVVELVKQESDVNIETSLLKRLLMEFKRKSDGLLKPDGSGSHTSPEEVFILLEIVAYGSCNPKYSPTLHEDSSLFINLGCLLSAIQKLGNVEGSIFQPVQKLDQIAPSSSADFALEREISYSMKTLIVKALANLLHRNPKNQALVREMDILVSILDCTSIDARNPMIKEYSILAIRNACEKNLENQSFIKGLTKVGDVLSPITSELTENVIRVKPDK